LDWLRVIAILSLVIGALCALAIAADLLKRPQHMWIMNIVWPLTALYAGPIGLWAYYRIGTLSSHESVKKAKQRGEKMPGKKKPFAQSVAIGATHCGSGCTLGDICAEWLIFFIPLTLFGKTIFAAWVLDYILAFLFGIAFQFFTIKPMRNLPTGQALGAAVKADTLSLTSWQIGMYGWMAVAVFLIFGHELEKTDPTFWFMMQIAMIAGFITSYPINWWLLRKGVKEVM
jgi:uncharacterized protein DUF4396